QIILTAGGPATQGASGQILAPSLSLLGTGSYSLNTASNDVNALAANVTNDVSYTDANALVISTIAATVGVTSITGAVSVDTVAGDLTVSQNVSAATTVSLSAGSTVASPDHLLTNNAAISGATDLVMSADRMA